MKSDNPSIEPLLDQYTRPTRGPTDRQSWNFRTSSRLWCAVIIQAVADVDIRIPKRRKERAGNAAEIADAEEIRDSARTWLASQDTGPQSFNWICSMLDLDAERIFARTLTREGRASLRPSVGKKKTRAMKEAREDSDSDDDVGTDMDGEL